MDHIWFFVTGVYLIVLLCFTLDIVTQYINFHKLYRQLDRLSQEVLKNTGKKVSFDNDDRVDII